MSLMGNQANYVLRIVCGERQVDLFQRQVDDHLVGWEIRETGRSLGQLVTLAAFVPGMAITSTWVALWAGARLLTTDVSTRDQQLCETREDIVFASHLDTGWLVITELGVERRSPDLLTVVARYDHSEVLLDGRLDGDRVLVRDFIGREVALDAESLLPLRS